MATILDLKSQAVLNYSGIKNGHEMIYIMLIK